MSYWSWVNALLVAALPAITDAVAREPGQPPSSAMQLAQRDRSKVSPAEAAPTSKPRSGDRSSGDPANATKGFDIIALIFTFEDVEIHRVMTHQGRASHSECSSANRAVTIGPLCFPEGFRVESLSFEATNPTSLKNPFIEKDNTCFSATGAKLTSVSANCATGEVTVRECKPVNNEDCSWALRNGTSFVASLLGRKTMSLQTASDATTWNSVQAGRYEYFLPDAGQSAVEPRYKFKVFIKSLETGKTVELTPTASEHGGFAASFDPSWRKLVVRVP